jgi:hypothetical protein
MCRIAPQDNEDYGFLPSLTNTKQMREYHHTLAELSIKREMNKRSHLELSLAHAFLPPY